MYNLISDPITKKIYSINSKEGLKILRKYIQYLTGGRIRDLPNPKGRRIAKKKFFPRCNKYYYYTKKSKKKTREYIPIDTYGPPACPDSIIKSKDNKIVYDKDMPGRFIEEKWDFKHKDSLKSQYNKKYKCKHKCKNKASCNKCIKKAEKCLECRKKTEIYYKDKLKDIFLKPKEKKRFRRLLRNVQQEIKFLEKLNKKNKSCNKK